MASNPTAAEPAETHRVDQELEQAARFHAEGRLGRARVCARRAAGWAIGPIYRRSTGDTPPLNAMTLLRWFHADPAASPELRHAAERLTVRVTEQHVLPHPEDPLADARRIIEVYGASTPGDDREGH